MLEGPEPEPGPDSTRADLSKRAADKRRPPHQPDAERPSGAIKSKGASAKHELKSAHAYVTGLL